MFYRRLRGGNSRCTNVNEAKSIDVQIAKINDQIEKSKIKPDKRNRSSQIRRTNHRFRKPLYKIADISEMTLRVYVSETQLSKIKVEQVTVKIDTENEMKSYPEQFLGLPLQQNLHKNHSNERRTSESGVCRK
jgi:hypothetical protein